MQKPAITVVVPAYNEEKYLPRTLGSIRRAEERLGLPVEIVVADNLSTDRTAEIARFHGAKVVSVAKRCISAVRNAGAASAESDLLVFVDADNQMSEDALQTIWEAMLSGHYVGGGMGNVRMERLSVGTFLFGMLPLWFAALVLRNSMCVFFVASEHFRAVGGFDEDTRAAEDYRFAKHLRREARKHNLRYKNLFRSHVVLSTRKYDEFGDYFLLMHPIKVLRACFGDQEVLDEFWYKPKR